MNSDILVLQETWLQNDPEPLISKHHRNSSTVEVKELLCCLVTLQ